LNEAKQKVNQFERESKKLGLKNIFQRRSSESEELSDKVLAKVTKID
jgi:hypothetical protein